MKGEEMKGEEMRGKGVERPKLLAMFVRLVK